MIKRFIERPVLSTVVSIIITLLGILALTSLPVSEYPEIAPPTVVVFAGYQGANADVVLNSVVIPLEEQINGVENMTYMTSSAGNDGSAAITVFFKLGTDPDLAAVNVQNRVSRALPLLPQEVTRAGVTTLKQQSGNVLIFALYSDNPAYDQTFIENYVSINLLPRIKRVPGVGDASSFGQMEYSMRIWLRPDVMANYGLVPNDVSAALAEQNIEAAPGQFGEQGKQSFQYNMKYKGRLKTPAEFGDMVIRSAGNGQLLRLKDIARVELGALNYSSISLNDGKPAAGVAISQTAGANAKEVIEGSIKLLDEASKTFPKGIHYVNYVNANDFLNASIEKVVHTLIEAFVLVFLVVFVFLQDFRSTLIPAIAVPVAIIGTFFFMQLFGFTLNLLTLFALVLAIGIVVDDAIVVVEAVHSKMEHKGLAAKEATIEAMKEISGAIISITLVMAAVFIPVGFMQGPAGVFYRQFAFTLATAILISALNALTLSPALCALLLKSPHAEGEAGNDHAIKRKGFGGRFFTAFNSGFKAITGKYVNAIKFLTRRKWVAISALVLLSGVTFWMMKKAPTGFIPTEDQGFILYAVNTPPGSSLDRTQKAMAQIDSIVQQEPAAYKRYTIDGLNFISNANASPYGAGFVR